jgi:transketolase
LQDSQTHNSSTPQLLGTRDVYGDTLALLGEKYHDIVVLDADLSGSTKTSVFAKKFASRFFNMGVSEQDLMGTAAGFAAGGKIPFASSFAIFATGKAWEQIRQSIAYPSLNVKIVATHGGITVGEDGGSHQTTEDISLMRILPNMTVIVPADGIETRKTLEAIVLHNGPVYMRLSRVKFPVIFDDSYTFRIGKGSIVREGRDVTVFACGYMLAPALRAREMLRENGIQAQVVNISTIKPIDEDLILSCAKVTRAIVTAEEHSIIGGLGSAVAEVISEKYPVPLRRIGVRDRFGTSGSAEDLVQYFGLTPEAIAKAALEVIHMKQNISGSESL